MVMGEELLTWLASPPPRRTGRICPNDGTALRFTRGVAYCPFDGWRGAPNDGEPSGPPVVSGTEGAGYGLTPYGSGPYGQ